MTQQLYFTSHTLQFCLMLQLILFFCWCTFHVRFFCSLLLLCCFISIVRFILQCRIVWMRLDDVFLCYHVPFIKHSFERKCLYAHYTRAFLPKMFFRSWFGIQHALSVIHGAYLHLFGCLRFFPLLLLFILVFFSVFCLFLCVHSLICCLRVTSDWFSG